MGDERSVPVLFASIFSRTQSCRNSLAYSQRQVDPSDGLYFQRFLVLLRKQSIGCSWAQPFRELFKICIVNFEQLLIIKAGTYTTDEVYVSGIISQIDNIDTGSYGNSTYYISDDGKTPTQLEVFRGYSVNGEKFKADDEIKVGDKVVVLGKLTLYKETPEFAQGSKIVSLNGGTVEPTPDPTPEPTPDPVGENLLSNGGFETWADGLPTGWKSASTASSATLSQSTTAKSGNYSVLVEGATGNKRLASAEMTLAAGTYKFTVFYKSAEAGVNASIELGYATVDAENKVNYVYPNIYVDSSDEWKEVSNTFTLEKETKLCLVVMNSKKPGKSVLIDDASLYAVKAASAKKR